jgi:AraC-like DNA-binding protein
VGLVHEALLGARQRGLDLGAVLAQARIDPRLLDAPRARVPALAYARLWAALADAMDDEFFGMDAHPMRRGSYRLMCHAVLGCDTLGRALQRMLTFLRAVLDDLRGELRLDGEHAVLLVHDQGPPRRMFTYATWLMLVHGLACWLVRRRLPLLEAQFRCPEPDDVADYRTRFCDAARFDAPVTLVRFEARLLALPVVESESTLPAFLRGAPANLLVKYRNEASLSAQIRRRLRGAEPEAWPELEALARSLALSGTTLQRRLQAEGLNYQRLKDALRRDIAIELLGKTDLAVADVGARVGFQETSAFHRAFKKWTGVNPGAYRRNHPDK